MTSFVQRCGWYPIAEWDLYEFESDGWLVKCLDYLGEHQPTEVMFYSLETGKQHDPTYHILIKHSSKYDKPKSVQIRYSGLNDDVERVLTLSYFYLHDDRFYLSITDEGKEPLAYIWNMLGVYYDEWEKIGRLHFGGSVVEFQSLYRSQPLTKFENKQMA